MENLDCGGTETESILKEIRKIRQMASPTLASFEDQELQIASADLENDHVEESGSSLGPWDIDQRMTMVEERVQKIETCLAELITQLNAESASGGRKNMVTQKEFGSWVDEAISKSHSLGCSKIFIRRFLCENYGQTDSKYMKKRLNNTLNTKVQAGILKQNNDLFSFV